MRASAKHFEGRRNSDRTATGNGNTTVSSPATIVHLLGHLCQCSTHSCDIHKHSRMCSTCYIFNVSSTIQLCKNAMQHVKELCKVASVVWVRMFCLTTMHVLVQVVLQNDDCMGAFKKLFSMTLLLWLMKKCPLDC